MNSPPLDEGQGSVVVRPARRGDARSYLALYRTVAAEERYIRTTEVHRSVRSFRKQFRRSVTPEDVTLVAVAERRVVGELAASREEHRSTRHVASLGMMVAPDWRGKGVGTELLAACIRWAADAGVEKLALSVYPDNAAAIALYRTFGFVEEGRLSGHSKKPSGYQDEIVMGLWLRDPPSVGPGDR